MFLPLLLLSMTADVTAPKWLELARMLHPEAMVALLATERGGRHKRVTGAIPYSVSAVLPPRRALCGGTALESSGMHTPTGM